jgi:hypothetical protein
VCLAAYKKLIAATFDVSKADDEQMSHWLGGLAGSLLEEACAFRDDYRIGARATMKSELIKLLAPLAGSGTLQ